MQGYKEPGFQDRRAAANQAREKALEKLRNKPQLDPAEVAALAERQRAREEAAAAKRAAAQQAKADALAAKQEAARLAAEAEAAKPQPKVLTEAERKALRDARYAARKQRKK